VGNLFLNGCLNDPFLKHGQFNGFYRADSRALAAQGAAVIAVSDLPRQVIKA
jgi:hypothetical protein